jgi:hypothetical protein
MKKMFLALGAFFAYTSANSCEISSASSNICSSSFSYELRVIDYNLRLRRAEQELKIAKENLLAELDIDVSDFDKDSLGILAKIKEIKKASSARKLFKFKEENEFCKLVAPFQEICDQLEKNPNIELFTVDNLSQKYQRDAISIGKTVFIDSKIANLNGIIIREIGNIVNDDRNTWLILRDLVIRRLEKNADQYYHIDSPDKSKKIAELFEAFSQKVEKKADLWSAANCKECASQLIDYFKNMKFQSSIKTCPDTVERIGYLSEMIT